METDIQNVQIQLQIVKNVTLHQNVANVQVVIIQMEQNVIHVNHKVVPIHVMLKQVHVIIV